MEKTFDSIPFTGVYLEAFGEPQASGLWLIYGAEKHGKTTFSLLLANELSQHKKVAFIMAEQGFDKDFQETLIRLSITTNNANLLFDEYVPITKIEKEIRKRRSPDIILLDNLTIYQDELKSGVLRRLLIDHPKKLFIMIAHEDKGQPYGATAKLARKLAKRVIHIEGMTANIGGRAPGGLLIIDEQKAALYFGTETTNNE